MAGLKLPKLARDGSLALIVRLVRETGREFLGRYIWVTILSVVIGATTALNAWLIKDVVNQIFFDRNAQMLYLLTAVVVANGFVRGFGLYASSVTLGRIGNAIVARVQNRLFDHLLRLGIAFYNRTPSSDLITRMSHNAAAARQVLDTVVTSAGRDLLSLLGLIVVMFLQSPLAAVIILIVAPATIVAVNGLVRRVRLVARAQFISLTRIVSDMQETAAGIRIVKAFNLEPLMRARMADSIADVQARADKIVRIGARTSPLMEVLGGFAIAMIVLWAGYQVVYYDVKPGALMSFIAAIALAYEPAKRLARTQVALETGLIGVRLMYELLDTPVDMNSNPDRPRLSVDGGEVAFDRVDFSYRAESPLFERLGFKAAAGKTTALVGPSGGGKSSIIALIERFYDVKGGRILIDGQDIASVELSSLRDNLALVSQDTVLFHDTIRQNIRFGRPNASDAEVEQAARDAMAHDFIVATERGYDTLLGDQAMQLSGGQRQRLAIARAMLRDAPIVLLDEATSALDTESEHQIQEAFARLTRGRTTIVIAHRLSTVLRADKICVLVAGRIVEEGKHAELLALNRHYARLYQLQFAHMAADEPGGGEAIAVPAQ